MNARSDGISTGSQPCDRRCNSQVDGSSSAVNQLSLRLGPVDLVIALIFPNLQVSSTLATRQSRIVAGAGRWDEASTGTFTNATMGVVPW
jgi:hypothetical protein